MRQVTLLENHRIVVSAIRMSSTACIGKVAPVSNCVGITDTLKCVVRLMSGSSSMNFYTKNTKIRIIRNLEMWMFTLNENIIVYDLPDYDMTADGCC